MRMSWKDEGPPKESNYDIAYKRMISSEKTFKRKDCLEKTRVQIISGNFGDRSEQGFYNKAM